VQDEGRKAHRTLTCRSFRDAQGYAQVLAHLEEVGALEGLEAKVVVVEVTVVDDLAVQLSPHSAHHKSQGSHSHNQSVSHRQSQAFTVTVTDTVIDDLAVLPGQ